MTRFNKPVRTGRTSPITSNPEAGLSTFEGAQGHKRDAKGELFVLAAGRFFGEKTFYETPDAGAQRFISLIGETTQADAPWTARFLQWLRSEANIRTAAVVGAVEYVRAAKAMSDNDWYSQFNKLNHAERSAMQSRSVVRSVLQRADEPGEMLAYFISRYGRSVPIAIKRGIADAIVGHGTDRKALYSEYSLLKYDTPSHGFRFGDVIELVHPTGEHPDVKGTALGALLGYAIDRRHGRDTDPGELGLGMIRRNAALRSVAYTDPRFLLDTEGLKEAGLTWEDALSLAGPGVDKAKLWEALIDADALGYMALIRNLRNFDEAGISVPHARRVVDMIADPARVKRSRQLPFRFLSAYHAAPSDRYKQALNDALDVSVQNIPELPGRTLVLVDTSGSMSWSNLSDRSSVRLVDAAALFGVALAQRCKEVELIGFATGQFRYELTKGASVLREVEGFARNVGKVGSGTQIAAAIGNTYAGHDRVVVFTDMQTMGSTRYGYRNGDVSGSVPANIPLYAWNLAGYEASMMPTGSGNRHEFGGFSDSAFSIMQTLEAGASGSWPF